MQLSAGGSDQCLCICMYAGAVHMQMFMEPCAGGGAVCVQMFMDPCAAAVCVKMYTEPYAGTVCEDVNGTMCMCRCCV